MGITTKIRKKDGEYRVRLYVDGTPQPDSDYFTDDKVDAEQTADAMVKQAEENLTKTWAESVAIDSPHGEITVVWK